MGEHIHEHSVVLVSTDGSSYRADTWGERRDDGTWWGWLEFTPNRDALAYWATGLEPVYLEGALLRARDVAE
jgi:hypothetical protein